MHAHTREYKHISTTHIHTQWKRTYISLPIHTHTFTPFKYYLHVLIYTDMHLYAVAHALTTCASWHTKNSLCSGYGCAKLDQIFSTCPHAVAMDYTTRKETHMFKIGVAYVTGETPTLMRLLSKMLLTQLVSEHLVMCVITQFKYKLPSPSPARNSSFILPVSLCTKLLSKDRF